MSVWLIAAAAVVGAGVFYFLAGFIVGCARAEKLPAGDAAVRLFNKRSGMTPDLPEKLRGVFWMATNKAPELVTTFDGERYDAAARQVLITSGGIYNWSYSGNLGGLVYWLFLKASYLCNCVLRVRFQDDELTRASMNLYWCNLCWCPLGSMRWEFIQKDENTWDRPIYVCCSSTPNSYMSYTASRVIDSNGNKLPAFDDMMKSVEEGLEGYPSGIYKKPVMQILNGDGCTCFSTPPTKAEYEPLH